jgi:hypothetical protein
MTEISLRRCKARFKATLDEQHAALLGKCHSISERQVTLTNAFRNGAPLGTFLTNLAKTTSSSDGLDAQHCNVEYPPAPFLGCK